MHGIHSQMRNVRGEGPDLGCPEALSSTVTTGWPGAVETLITSHIPILTWGNKTIAWPQTVVTV